MTFLAKIVWLAATCVKWTEDRIDGKGRRRGYRSPRWIWRLRARLFRLANKLNGYRDMCE